MYYTRTRLAKKPHSYKRTIFFDNAQNWDTILGEKWDELFCFRRFGWKKARESLLQ